jgi:MarR family transcriptional regulator, multiple antibiotic resistance protein MarR
MAYSEAVRFFDSLVRCETRLYNELSDRLRARHGVSLAQLEFLLFIRDHEAARVGDLAAAFAVGVGATSKGIDRLEAQGWVARRPNPANRRSSILSLTPAGHRLTGEGEATFTAELTALLSGALSASQIRALTGPLDILRARLEADGSGTPAG